MENFASYLITGGCGFIGANLIRYLLKENPNTKIRVLDNLSVGTRGNLAEVCNFVEVASLPFTPNSSLNSVELIIGDIRDKDICMETCKGIDAVIHFAAHAGVIPSIEDPYNDFEVNVLGTLNLLYASVKNKVDKFIFASSNAPVGDQTPPMNEERAPKPLSPYGASKLACEGYCSAFHGSYGLKTVVLRFSNAYGPYSLHKNSVISKFITPNSSLLTNNIWGETFHLGTGKETSIINLANYVKELFGGNVKIVFEPERKGEIKRNYSDISKAKAMLGFESKTTLEAGIKMVYKWFMRQGIESLRKSRVLSGSE